MTDQYYIQYHNADQLGRYPSSSASFSINIDSVTLNDSIKFDSWFYTKKKAIEKSIGCNCFMIVGKTEEAVKKYFLWSYCKLEEYEVDDNGYYVVSGTGFNLTNPIFLNGVENFNDFKIFCGNFGLGFQNISNHSFCKTLVTLMPESKLKAIENLKHGEYVRPTTEQYQDVIARILSPQQIEILQVLHGFPNSSATTEQLTEALQYKAQIQTNSAIGRIGKAFYKNTGIEPPPSAYTEGSFAYFYFVGEYRDAIGWVMWGELKQALENLHLVKSSSSLVELPTELNGEGEFLYAEGKTIKVFVNRYERNQQARFKCILHYGATCQGCGFDFEKMYGSVATGFIQVHHIIPLSEIGKSYNVDPVKDLIPLCANCHSVVHLVKPAMTIDELKKLINTKCSDNLSLTDNNI